MRKHRPGPPMKAGFDVGADIRDLNLTNLDISCADANTIIKDPSFDTHRGGVYFRNLREHLLDYIERAEYILGCCAWVTDMQILTALGRKKGVSILVQKEDFLRPDGVAAMADIRRLYMAIPGTDRMSVGAGNLSTGGGWECEAIRSVGVRGDKHGLHPKMHHKFVLLCKGVDRDLTHEANYYEPDLISPYAVWTGSFNFTDVAGRSLENAIVLTDPRAVQAYHEEYKQVLALSEPLDWHSPYVCPQWRIGT